MSENNGLKRSSSQPLLQQFIIAILVLLCLGLLYSQANKVDSPSSDNGSKAEALPPDYNKKEIF